MQLLSQQREFLRHPGVAAAGRIFRSGLSQAVLLSSYVCSFSSAAPWLHKPPTPLPRLLWTAPTPGFRPPPGYSIPSRRLPLVRLLRPGLPGSSADLSLRAAPSHPGKSGDCFYPLLHRQYQASSNPADCPLPSRNEAETGSLALRLAGSSFEASLSGLLRFTLD